MVGLSSTSNSVLGIFSLWSSRVQQQHSQALGFSSRGLKDPLCRPHCSMSCEIIPHYTSKTQCNWSSKTPPKFWKAGISSHTEQSQFSYKLSFSLSTLVFSLKYKAVSAFPRNRLANTDHCPTTIAGQPLIHHLYCNNTKALPGNRSNSAGGRACYEARNNLYCSP